MRLWYKMLRGEKFQEALKEAKRMEEERAKEGDMVRIRPYKDGGNVNYFREGLREFFPKPAKPFKTGGSIMDNLGAPLLMKDGGEVPHNMIKHSSPLAMNEHGLFQHDLYNAVQQTGFGIKSYVKYV